MRLSSSVVTAAVVGVGVLGSAGEVGAQMRGGAVDLEWPHDGAVVEVPFEYYHGWPIIPVSINGSRPLRFILDTGSPMMLFPNAALGDSLGLEITRDVMIGGDGTGDRVSAGMARADVAAIGPLQIRGGGMLVGGLGDLLRGIDGVIGGSVFRNAVVEIDAAAMRIRLHDPASFTYSGPGAEISLRIAQGHAYLLDVPVSIDGQQWIQVNLHLDTGRGSAMALSLAPEAIPPGTIDALIGWGAQGPVYGTYGRVTEVRLGDTALRRVVSSFDSNRDPRMTAPAPGLTSQGAVGMGLLKRFRTFIDFRGRRVILAPTDATDGPFPFNTTGIQLAPWAPGVSALTIGFVIPESPAAGVGLRAGDLIRTIDGRAVETLTADEIDAAWRREPGAELRVTIEREGRRIDMRLVAANLI